MGYSLFQPSTLGLMSQAHALNTIGSNISNVNTGGFRRTDTRFETVLSNTLNTGVGANSSVSYASPDSALGGVKPKDYQIIDQQGFLNTTERDLDLAIIGDGFFVVSPTLALSSKVLYTRDGSFEINIAGPTVTVTGDDGNTFTAQQGYLTDKNGYFVLGFTADPTTGVFPTTGTVQPMRVDQYAFSNQFRETTSVDLSLNLPASTQFGGSDETFPIMVIDSAGQQKTVNLTFAKTPTNNQWQMLLSGDGLTTSTIAPGAAFSVTTGAGTGRVLAIDVASREITVKNETNTAVSVPAAFQGLQVGDSITLAGSGAGNNGTYTIGAISADGGTITLDAATPLPGASESITTAASLSSTASVGDPLVFNGVGSLQSPASMTLNLTWDDGNTNAFTLDMSNSTQFATGFTLTNFSQDGLSDSNIRRITFSSAGVVVGEFEDGTTRPLYKIPLATFVNPNGLEMLSGNVFAESPQSGAANVVAADVAGIATFAPNTVELSNVDLTSEFARMIQVQQAYNASATTFKTVDEMTIVARDLKA